MRYLISIKPEEPAFAEILRNCEFVANIDRRIIRTMFAENVTKKYYDRIIARDEAFFLDPGVYDRRVILSSGYNMDIIGKLCGMWGALDDAKKGHIWNYCIVLVNMSKSDDCGFGV
ncbi:hypothetical protein FOA52_011845 [Chlamydomonas sp. UWO 241]|nr:hypothetical protein FOA52_011845 [Chlamydomonas sp. UWO 241]